MFGSPRTPATPVTGRPSLASKRASTSGTPSSLRAVKRTGVARGRQSLAPSSLAGGGGGVGGVSSPGVLPASAQRRLPVASDGSHVTEAYGSSLPVRERWMGALLPTDEDEFTCCICRIYYYSR